MGWLIKILKWFWKAFSIFAPIASVLWGATIYSGIAMSLYIIVKGTADMVSDFNATFQVWADNLSVSIVEIFSSVTENSIFQFLAYVLSLDVPFEWFRSCSDSFLRSWLSYIVGTFLAALEVCIIVLGVYFVRSRLKKMSVGINGGNDV